MASLTSKNIPLRLNIQYRKCMYQFMIKDENVSTKNYFLKLLQMKKKLIKTRYTSYGRL